MSPILGWPSVPVRFTHYWPNINERSVHPAMNAFPAILGRTRLARVHSGFPALLRQRPVLRFSPPAWSKLLYWQGQGATQIGAFGITLPDDPLLVTDVRLVRQNCAPDFLLIEEASVADYFNEQVILGRHPDHFARVWIRLQAGDQVLPNRTDEDTCRQCFGRTDWMVLCVLGRNDRTWAQLRFHVGPGGFQPLTVSIDFRQPFAASDMPAWEREYRTQVITEKPF